MPGGVVGGVGGAGGGSAIGRRRASRAWGRERITTPIGPVEAVIWSSARVGSNRVTKVWYATEFGFLPVRAERRRGDKLEWAMHLKTLKSSAK